MASLHKSRARKPIVNEGSIGFCTSFNEDNSFKETLISISPFDEESERSHYMKLSLHEAREIAIYLAQVTNRKFNGHLDRRTSKQIILDFAETL